MYITNLAEYFCNKNWKSLECTNAQSNLNKIYSLPGKLVIKMIIISH